MFTGIIEEIGIVRAVKRNAHSAVLTIEAAIILDDIKKGDSIAVNGICLTVTSFHQSAFTADVMPETMSCSALNKLYAGSHVNLERAMPANGRFGGHIVTGHIDGTGMIGKIQKDDNAVWYTIHSSPVILRYIIEKGSVAVDGISLTVAKVSSDGFQVSVIPHTAEHTALSEKRIGDAVNIENDCIGKYVEKMLEKTSLQKGVTKELLQNYGF